MTGIDKAYEYLGKQEIRDRKELMSFMKKYKIYIDPKTTPWCAGFVNACERSVGKPGTGLLNARSFLKYGKVINRGLTRIGDILVFARGSNGWSGHVAYLLKWDDANNRVLCLGGNQSDMVCKAWYSQDRLLGIRRYE
ncbi:MAG TPA: TIGR02594 family protein [Nitrososphaeraceae archaeon]